MEKIDYRAEENKMYFTGPIRGSDGNYNIEANHGVYDSKSGILEIEGNLKIYNKTGKLIADRGTYNTKTKDLYMTSKKVVIFEDQDKRITTKDFTYNDETKKLKLTNNYTYDSSDYSSRGRELYYDDTTKIGKIIGGTFKGNNIVGSADITDFDLLKKQYVFTGDAEVTSDNSTLKSEKIEVDDLSKIAKIDGEYTIYNSDDKTTMYGQKATYNMKTGDLVSLGKIKVVQTNKILTGINLNYNSNTGDGTIEKDIVLVDDTGARLTGDRAKFNSKEYAEIIGNLKITTKDGVMDANRGKYVMAEKAVYIPGEITINSKNGHATMDDGVYYTAEDRVEAKNFVGVSEDKRAVGDIVNYFVSRQVAQLEKNVVVSNPEMKFVGEQVEYSFLTEEVSTAEKYKIYYSNYIIDGETLKGNMNDEVLDGTKVNINSLEGEQLYGDFMYANLKNKQIDLDGHVRTLTYSVDKKTKKREPVKIRGDTAKIFLYDDINGKLAVSRAEVKKNGIYEYQDMTLYSDYMEIDVVRKLALGRYGSRVNIGGKTNVKSEIADINMNTEIAVLTNNVKFDSINEKGEKIYGSSDKGKIYNRENMAILEENVKADTPENHIEADYAEYHMDTGILKTRGNVRLDQK